MERRDARPEHQPLPEALLHAVAARFRVLGTASRLRILDALMEAPLPMSELVARSGLEQSNLSRRVSELEAAGCVRRMRRGREVVVELADPSLRRLCELVCGALREQADARRSALLPEPVPDD